jgi:hypothetical protein
MAIEDRRTFGVSIKSKTSLIYVLAYLVRDRAFPLRDGDSLALEIERQILIVRKEVDGRLP